jgi:GntR family transcriptional regulator
MMSNIISSDWILQRRRAEPLPQLLAQFLRDAIREGKLNPGERLPGENDLARQLGVSRTTLRAAVEMLLAQRILERRHGIGTFVANGSLMMIAEGLESLASTTALIRKHGYEPGTAEFRSEVIPASPQLAETMKVPPNTSLLHLSRTRTANRKPVIQAEEYISTAILAPDSLPSRRTDWSLYELLKVSGSPIASAVCRIRAVTANGTLARQLKVPLRYPLLLLTQVHYGQEDQPILYCENYHNSAIIDFQVLRHG